ncbi:MAG: Ig-like domain-containing protein [Candidatus Geothermincolia bacterium]
MRRFTILAALALGLVLVLICCSGPAQAYPNSSETVDGWTGEAVLSSGSKPRHVRLASAGSVLYCVAEENGDIVFRRSLDGGETWRDEEILDKARHCPAEDPYICTNGSWEVCVSWKEFNVDGCGKWALVFRNSINRGVDWFPCQADAKTQYNNYEGHMTEDTAGNVYLTYVSDRTGRNEVYFNKRNVKGEWNGAVCISGATDAVAASLPCIEANDAHISIYYQKGNASPHSIVQALSRDGGSTFTPYIIHDRTSDDCAWPECINSMGTAFLVFQARNIYDNSFSTYLRYYTGSAWTSAESIKNTGARAPYPQITAYPRIPNGYQYVMVTMNDGLVGGGFGKLSLLTAQQGQWSDITHLFYKSMPADDCSATSCLINANGFFACSAGENGSVMFKRMDGTDPTLSFAAPTASPSYFTSDFSIRLNASDDWSIDANSFLSPHSEHYDQGMVHADLEYAPHGSTAFAKLPGEATKTKADAPWQWTFRAALVEDGRYDFRATVYDTAGNSREAYLYDMFLDRHAPTAAISVKPPNGQNGWYSAQPEGLVSLTSDDGGGSGADATFYRFDGGEWTRFSTPFALLEGSHKLEFYSVDRAGNSGEVGNYPYKLDLTAPDGLIGSPDPMAYFRERLGASVIAQDGISGVWKVQLLLNEDMIAELTSAPWDFDVDLSGRPDSEYGLRAAITDMAGHCSVTEARAVRKDTRPPSIRIVSPSNEHWLRGMVTISAQIEDNFEVGSAKFYVDNRLIDERTSFPWMAAWDTSTIQNGAHQIAVHAVDAAGNQTVTTSSGQLCVYVGNNISETSHYAEGCTRDGFDTWLCLQNPGVEQANVTVNYMLAEGQGEASARVYAVPPHSRMTVFVNQDVGPDKDVSIQVTSSKPIVSERPMYFDYRDKWQGSHTALGAHFPLTEWYFAEGCTRPGFEEWLCIQNPMEQPANVTIEYMLQDASVRRQSISIEPWSRYTVNVNEFVGDGQDVSVRISSDQPVVAERPMYFLYQGMWDGGHNVMGAATPEDTWYFAEGCTRPGFNQWICIQNPNDEAAIVKLSYMTEDGGEIEKDYQVAAHSRCTVNVNTDVARFHDVSTKVTSDKPIVVERPMYFDYASIIDEGSNAMGVNKPSSSWYLAEGCTREGFEEWICLQNPSDVLATARIRYMLEDGSTQEQVVKVPPHTRVTVKVNDVVGAGHDVSAEIMSDVPIIVERPMYSVYRGACPAADTLAGYTFDQ